MLNFTVLKQVAPDTELHFKWPVWLKCAKFQGSQADQKAQSFIFKAGFRIRLGCLLSLLLRLPPRADFLSFENDQF